ncbi:hypothetical protein E2I00_001199, partial [Balaenoptera physalus]
TLFILTIPIIITNANIYKSNKYPPYGSESYLFFLSDDGMVEQTEIQLLSKQFYITLSETVDLLYNRGPYPRFSFIPLKRNGCSSQLGLIMVTIGINQPYLAFLHICTHAFLKAILFMCSRLALTGIPFLTGFYSEDLIIKTTNMSYTNA